MSRCLQRMVGAILFGVVWCAAGSETVLRDDFSTNAPGDEVPAGWMLYRQGPNLGKVGVRPEGKAMRLYLKDVCNKSEIGVTRILPAVKGKYYRLTATAIPANGGRIERNTVVLQLRFLGKPHRITSVRMVGGQPAAAEGQADADRLQIYLFTMKPGMPEFFVSEIRLEMSDTPFK